MKKEAPPVAPVMAANPMLPTAKRTVVITVTTTITMEALIGSNIGQQQI